MAVILCQICTHISSKRFPLSKAAFFGGKMCCIAIIVVHDVCTVVYSVYNDWSLPVCPFVQPLAPIKGVGDGGVFPHPRVVEVLHARKRKLAPLVFGDFVQPQLLGLLVILLLQHPWVDFHQVLFGLIFLLRRPQRCCWHGLAKSWFVCRDKKRTNVTTPWQPLIKIKDK